MTEGHYTHNFFEYRQYYAGSCKCTLAHLDHSNLRLGHTGERICNGEQTDKNVQNLVIR